MQLPMATVKKYALYINKRIYLKKIDTKYICNFSNDMFCFAVRPPRPENSYLDEKDALFRLNTEITI
jgi:hypothetical protein